MPDALSAMARFFELPEEILLDMPKVTILGNVQVLVENHRGLVGFRPERVTVKTTRGELTVEGRDLRIGAVDRETVVLTGAIARVALKP